jgi:ligand-binding sensor domain-containing protein
VQRHLTILRAHLHQCRAIVLWVLLTWCPAVPALDAALDVSQYGHNAWKIREGFPKRYVSSIAQTPDGYLWLGTVTGLIRFDGVRGVSWQPPAGEQLPSNVIRKLFVARDGRLWIGTAKGLVSWKAGTLTRYPELDGQVVLALLEDRQGAIWVGSVSPFATGAGKLCEILLDGVHCVGEDGSIGEGVYRLYEDKRSDLWTAGPKGVWHWKPGPPKLYPILDQASLFESDDGVLSVLSRSGITRIIGGEEATHVHWRTQTTPTTALFLDRDGGRWIGTLERGLLHVHQGHIDTFALSDGLSGDWVTAIYEDLEGDVWVATVDGLDRFRNVGVATLSAKQGLSTNLVSSVLAATDGTVWVGTYEGLNRWADGQLTIYRKRSARPASNGAKRESTQRGALDALGKARVAREIADSGLPDDYITSLFQDERRRIWVATRGGLAYFQDGRFAPVAGVSGEWVNSFAGDGGGNLWISQQGALVRIRDGTVVERTPWATIGRPARAQALLFDSMRHGLWLGFPEGGLAFLEDGRVRASFAAADGLGEGMVADLQLEKNVALWASTQGE